ncbi:MAG: phenylalanine--tRNA ligase beta subunit-related protein [Methanolinea sp.]|nr:phenylalanine--tRNA ligase beta subunit-related protein [Methanolinea sp.]
MEFSQDIVASFPGICVAEGDIRSVRVTRESPGLEIMKKAIVQEIKSCYTLEQVKDDPLFRAYRDFFWSVGVDPTKTRPASEALVRRILAGKGLPSLNSAVDAYNLASAESGVPIAAFDADALDGDLMMRFARDGEQFLGIGMEKPLVLRRNQVIIVDSDRVIALYPYRDSHETKVTMETRNIHIVTCGAPGVAMEMVIRGYTLAAEYLERYAGGRASKAVISPG